MKRPTLADLSHISQFVSISSAMLAILLGFILPSFYLGNRSALWLLPKMASSQYASIFVVAFMMVMLLMAAPAIVSFVLALTQQYASLKRPKLCGLIMMLLGVCSLVFASLPLLSSPFLRLTLAVISVATLGVGIDMLSGFWDLGTRDPTKYAGNSEAGTATLAPHSEPCRNVMWPLFWSLLIRGFGGFLALVLSWLDTAAAVSTKSIGPHANCRIAAFLIVMAVLLTTLGNALGVWVARRYEGPYKTFGILAILLSLLVFGIGQQAPVPLFVMRISGMGGIYESVYLKAGVNEKHILPGFDTKAQHGPLKVCMVAQGGGAFYISWLDTSGPSKKRPGACAEQIGGPYFYRIWRLPRADVAWVQERKPLTSPASRGANKSNVTKSGAQHAPA